MQNIWLWVMGAVSLALSLFSLLWTLIPRSRSVNNLTVSGDAIVSGAVDVNGEMTCQGTIRAGEHVVADGFLVSGRESNRDEMVKAMREVYPHQPTRSVAVVGGGSAKQWDAQDTSASGYAVIWTATGSESQPKTYIGATYPCHAAKSQAEACQITSTNQVV